MSIATFGCTWDRFLKYFFLNLLISKFYTIKLYISNLTYVYYLSNYLKNSSVLGHLGGSVR